MKTPHWKTQVLGMFDGFRIELSFDEEHIDAKDHFLNLCEWSKDQYKEISNFYWFTAKITAYKGSIECGSSYLGGNCYSSLKEVMQDGSIENILGGYCEQMIEEAIEEAKDNLSE